jgi:hypothetical protein
MRVNPVPDGYHVVTPILLVEDADALIAFMQGAFGAREHQIGRRPDGRVYGREGSDGHHLVARHARRGRAAGRAQTA